MTEPDMNIYSGLWRCAYWFPSNNHDGDDVDQYRMHVHRDGNELVFESYEEEGQAYMLVRLSIDDDIATGTWYETTAIDSEFKGAIYSGAGQLLVDPKTGAMRGKWAGSGLDHASGKIIIYTGDWEIVRLDEAHK